GSEHLGRDGCSDAAAGCEHRLAVAQIEAESDMLAANHAADVAKPTEIGQCLERDNDACGAESDYLARSRDGVDAGIEEDWSASRCNRGDDRIVRRSACKRVEVGEVHLGDAKQVDIRAHEPDGVTVDRGPRNRSHRLILVTPPGAGVDRTPVTQIDDSD